jgi:hypothetical protein
MAFILWMLVASSYLVIRGPVVRERIPGEMVAPVRAGEPVHPEAQPMEAMRRRLN